LECAQGGAGACEDFYKESNTTALGAVALQSVSMAMRNGALQKLEELELENCTLSDGHVRGFADALKESGCAGRLTALVFVSCRVDVEGVRLLADLFSRGVFPALKCLDLEGNPNISDVGVMALAEALLKSTQTCLKTLGLKNVEMGDEGISTLASLALQGRLEHLTWLDIFENDDLTKQGIITLARAIDARGLPMLEAFAMEEFWTTTAVGTSAVAHAVFEGCPRLKKTFLTRSGSDIRILNQVIQGMLEAAGRAGKVEVVYGE